MTGFAGRSLSSGNTFPKPTNLAWLGAFESDRPSGQRRYTVGRVTLIRKVTRLRLLRGMSFERFVSWALARRPCPDHAPALRSRRQLKSDDKIRDGF